MSSFSCESAYVHFHASGTRWNSSWQKQFLIIVSLSRSEGVEAKKSKLIAIKALTVDVHFIFPEGACT